MKALRWAWASLVFLPQVSSAHVMGQATGGFANGFIHPLSGLDHVIAMLAVGLWGAILGGRAIWLLPITFPLVMAVGGFLGLIGVPLPAPELAIALSGIILGLCVLWHWRATVPVALALVGVFGLFHGYAHGAELPAGAAPIQYSLGFVIATGLLHASGIGLGLLQRYRYGGGLIRTCGAVICGGGVFFLARAL